MQRIESTADSFGVITLTTKDIAFYGIHKDIRVIEVNQTEALLAFHNQLLNGIKQMAELNHKSFVGPNFKPHITLRDDRNLKKGKTISCRQLFVVAKGDRNTRQIVHQIKLS